jgi:hypothetical protein
MLFQKNPEKTLQRDIDATRANRDRLSAKLAETETAIKERREAAQALARDSDDDDALGKAEAATRAVQDRAATIAGALTEVTHQLAHLETAQAAHLDTKQRGETATQIEVKAAKLEKLVPVFDSLFEQMIEITAEDAATLQIWDAVCLHKYAKDSKIQIPAAIELVARSYRERRDRVLDGRSAAVVAECASLDAGAQKVMDVIPLHADDSRFTRIDRGPVVELRIPREVES